MTVTQQDAEALASRIIQARERLAEAAATADQAGIAGALDDLDQAYDQAREYGVVIAWPRTETEETQS